jgi:thiol-disulfide isomerase/thioredoxin
MARILNICMRAAGLMLASAIVVTQLPLAFAQQPPGNFVAHDEPQPGATVRFEDEQGRPRSIADFRGKIVLLNVWATWCVPCIKEIPALDHLAAALNDADFEVVAVSIDRRGIDTVRKAFRDRDVRRLPIYIDRSGEALRTVRAVGLPASLLLDREGRELGRAAGAAQWDDSETIAFFRHIVSGERQTDVQAGHTHIEPGK